MVTVRVTPENDDHDIDSVATQEHVHRSSLSLDLHALMGNLSFPNVGDRKT